MGLKEIAQKIGGTVFKDEKPEVMQEGQTLDKGLVSLRRMRQKQMEQVEKEQLKKKIVKFEKDERTLHLFGVKGKIKGAEEGYFGKKKFVKKSEGSLLSRGSMMGQSSMLRDDSSYFKKKKRLI